MADRNIVNKDSDASAFIEQKDVILCRSGIQMYRHSEVEASMSEGNRPPVVKEWYREYRPANVVVKALEKCRSLPVTKEHPDEWVTPQNFSTLAGGTTDKEVTVVALDGESEGEIGLKSNITFYTDTLYDYYQDNKEVSLGYTCKKHWVDNPEEVGYDIVLDEITEVNHLAITMAGRGGSSVAVIDSKLGGLKPMKTGFFAWLSSQKQTDTAAEKSFGEKVVETLKMEKEEDKNKAFDSVLDSCGTLKDGEGKTLLVDAVRDCFENKDKALADIDNVAKTLDSMWVSVYGDSIESIQGALAGKENAIADINISVNNMSELSGKKDAVATADACAETKDEKKEEASKDSETEEKKEDETKDSETEKKKEESKDSEETKEDEKKEENKDSFDKGTLIAEIKDSIKDIVAAEVRSALGINKDSKADVKGLEIDNVKDSLVANDRDYLSLLD